MFKFATRFSEGQTTLVFTLLATSAIAFVNLMVLAVLAMVPVWPLIPVGLTVVVSAWTLVVAVALRD